MVVRATAATLTTLADFGAGKNEARMDERITRLRALIYFYERLNAATQLIPSENYVPGYVQMGHVMYEYANRCAASRQDLLNVAKDIHAEIMRESEGLTQG